MKALKNEMRAKAKLIRAGLDYTSESAVICGLISRWEVFQKATSGQGFLKRTISNRRCLKRFNSYLYLRKHPLKPNFRQQKKELV